MSRICRTNSGPIRLSGGLSSTTRHSEGVTRSSLTCAAFVADGMTLLITLVARPVVLRVSSGGFQGAGGAREEAEQRSIDLLGVCPAEVVRAALDRHDRYVRDELAQPCGGGLERQ